MLSYVIITKTQLLCLKKSTTFTFWRSRSWRSFRNVQMKGNGLNVANCKVGMVLWTLNSIISYNFIHWQYCINFHVEKLLSDAWKNYVVPSYITRNLVVSKNIRFITTFLGASEKVLQTTHYLHKNSNSLICVTT